MSSLRAYQGRMGRGGGGTQQGMPVINGAAWDTGQPNGQSQFGRRVSTDQVLNNNNVLFTGGGHQVLPATTSAFAFVSGFFAPSSCPTSRGNTNMYGTGLCGCNFRRVKMKVTYSGKSTNMMGIGDTGTNQMGIGFMFASDAQKLGINYRNLRSSPFSGTEQKTGNTQYGPVSLSAVVDPNPKSIQIRVYIVTEQHEGDSFIVVPMNQLTRAVDILFNKNYTLYKSKGGDGKIVTYDCATNQVVQGDPHKLWPTQSKFAYAYHY